MLLLKVLHTKASPLSKLSVPARFPFGRQNKMGGPADMMAWQRDHGVLKAVWDRMDEDKKLKLLLLANSPSVFFL